MTNKTPFSTLTSIQRLTMKMESNYWMYIEKVNGKNLIVCIEKTEKGYEVTNLDDNSFYGIGKNFMQAIAIIYKVNTGKNLRKRHSEKRQNSRNHVKGSL